MNEIGVPVIVYTTFIPEFRAPVTTNERTTKDLGHWWYAYVYLTESPWVWYLRTRLFTDNEDRFVKTLPNMCLFLLTAFLVLVVLFQ